MDLGLAGKTVIVTGGSGGIGRVMRTALLSVCCLPRAALAARPAPALSPGSLRQAPPYIRVRHREFNGRQAHS